MLFYDVVISVSLSFTLSHVSLLSFIIIGSLSTKSGEYQSGNLHIFEINGTNERAYTTSYQAYVHVQICTHWTFLNVIARDSNTHTRSPVGLLSKCSNVSTKGYPKCYSLCYCNIRGQRVMQIVHN